MDDELCECLRGAGCAAGLQESTERLCDAGHAAEAIPGLARRRMELLDELRDCNRRLDCLDRAISRIRKSL